MTFSKPDELSEPLFKESEILKLADLVTLYNALLIPITTVILQSFEIFFKQYSSIHTLI